MTKKKYTLTFLLSVVINLSAFSTDQAPDLLITGTDTFFLKSFPIDKLNFKEKLNPFDSGMFVATNCWRGYQAIWEIKNNKIYLQKVRKCNSDSIIAYSNVINFFNENGYHPKIQEGKIFADWYTANLIECEFYECKGRKNYLQSTDKLKRKNKLLFTFINGELIKNDT